MRRVFHLTFVILGLLCMWVNSGSAARLTEQLTTTLSKRAESEFVSVLVFMREQPDASAIAARLKPAHYSRQASHELIVAELQRFAAEKQSGIKQMIDDGVARGEVESYESYWIANVLKVAATKAFINALQSRPDVEIMAEDLPMQALYYPPNPTLAVSGERGASVALHAIGADSMWAIGYTGAGSLIASFDTGINGNHPALHDSYRGNNGYSARESWFDPVYGQTYPHWGDALPASAHGTATMGIMVGKDDATGDTVGVAFGAQWISAMVVDVPGANYVEAFQWAADPDGNLNTIDDVPDVLNNSWGFKQNNVECIDIFWAPIDNLEALGTVVVFAAGNEGPNAMSLRNPANRATTPYNTFAVGAVSPTNTDSIWALSSRGPSDCDDASIKPEVVAPGYQVRTTNANLASPYVQATGTSFAVAYVSGAVAMLRQYNPNASVEAIKSALMNSAIDKGVPGEDNTFGWGVLNIPAALALMPPNNQINIYVRWVDPDSVGIGAEANVVVTLTNSGLGTTAVTGVLTNPDPGLTIISGTGNFGNMPSGASASNSGTPFKLSFGSALPEGSTAAVSLHIQAGGGSYQRDLRLHFAIGTPLAKSAYTHVTDSCRFTVSNYGTYGLAPESIQNRGGIGFTFPANGTNNLYQCGLLIGTDTNHVSDGIVNLLNIIDVDFAVAPGGNLTHYAGGGLGDFETTCRFNDASASKPIGIFVKQRTATFSAAADAQYVILEYVITNRSTASIGGMYVGIFCDWDFPWGYGSSDRTGFARDLNLGYLWQQGPILNTYRGTAVLSRQGASTFYAIHNLGTIYDVGGNGLVSERAKYSFLTHGFADTASSSPYDQSYCIAAGPINLAPGQADTVAFAMIGAANLASLRNSAASARARYNAATVWLCGDADGNAMVDVSDVVYLIDYIFGRGPAPAPLLAGDADCSFDVNLVDAVYLVNYIFGGGPTPCAACPKQ